MKYYTFNAHTLLVQFMLKKCFPYNNKMNCKTLTIITPVLNLFEFLVSTYAHATRLNEMNDNLKILCFPKVTMHRQKDNFILSHFLGNG